jgi:calcium/calmodulin-dependent protein kinase I
MTAKVFRARRREDGRSVAVKQIFRSRLGREDRSRLRKEISILRSLDHERIYKLIDVVETDGGAAGDLFLVLELVDGGELFARICEREMYSEEDARILMRELLEALAYLHANGVAHRDVKPENVCLRRRDSDTGIKLVDFGLAERIESDGEVRAFCGTGMYAPPEVFREQLTSQKMDVWAAGVVAYILLCGQPPFDEDDHEMSALEFRAPPLDEATGEEVQGENIWDAVSEPAKAFVRTLLDPDRSTRPTAEAALALDWMRERAPRKHMRHSQHRIRKMHAARQLRSAVRAVSALNKLRGRKTLGALHPHETHSHSHPLAHARGVGGGKRP